MAVFKYFLVITGTALIFLFALILLTSLKEKRKRPIIRSFFILPICGFLILIFLYGNTALTITISAILFCVISYLLLPAFLFKRTKESIANGRIDERITMFSRRELKPETERFINYYKNHPAHKESDEAFRKLPGLLSPQSKFASTLAYNASDAIFQIVDSLHHHVNGQPHIEKKQLAPENLERFIKEWTLKSGAVSVGFTAMKDYHWYSFGGRKERYDQPVNTNHLVGIAFTVEMDQHMVEAAPQSSIIMESATQYLNAGIIATQLAQFIRNMGYEARAHIDGNYQVVAPLVARDANLGEIGRMGLLMTPQLGPRVRIGIVTTNMPLPTPARHYDPSMEDFCAQCLKCAENCPASAISSDDQKLLNNTHRWQINSEKCFHYWCTAGTDCGRCMSVCPYSHPDNLMHNVVRLAIKQFPNFRYWAVKMDDFFYGRKVKPAQLPKWIS